ncbi:MAG: BREX-2 system adenine-specific DNA-methyltransferase PglX [Deltaproteobacteria bacterium]|nr:BREX-2 system adenine-specific DNA-methyltransferase PglX [Myxococcales bacterium]MDP3220356.1 BREX-2 system adenine-specific DNA-methyltransferase PglX [Deltaproteobacteria bacterium]
MVPSLTQLTPALSALSQRIAADLRVQILAPGPASDRARALHADERVGDDFAVWTDLLSRRAAVLWVLRSVYVRVLEDRGLLRPLRIVDAESQHLFERLAPNLGQTSYLRWVYRDLASADAGLPELFAPQPAEVALPSDALSRELLDFWRERDPDTGALRWAFTDAHFDGRLMGDLYQDLDPVVKDRFALRQTPDFILDFILDETLTPAIAEWGVETVRLIDPACGSGHFLLAGFKRLVAGMREKFPERGAREVVLDVLRRVVGLDLNDYACALARARLVMTALELCGENDLAEASAFHPQVYWTDALEQVEREEWTQLGLPMGGTGIEKPRAMLTRPEVRMELRPLLKQGFHAVVGNPPYISEKDPRQKEYHRQKVGKGRRYASAERQYTLGTVFVERMLQLGVPGATMGAITAEAFTRCDFGKSFVEQVLARHDLQHVVDTSGIVIPEHGTPTIILIARARAPVSANVLVTMSRRGDPGDADPANGPNWRGILSSRGADCFEDEHISSMFLSRAALSTHEWSFGGSAAVALQHQIEGLPGRLLDAEPDIGRTNSAGEDEIWFVDRRTSIRLAGFDFTIPIIIGKHIESWSASGSDLILYPYSSFRGVDLPSRASLHQNYLWRYRATLQARKVFDTLLRDVEDWWRHLEYYQRRVRQRAIATTKIGTSPDFALCTSFQLFKESAPAIFLPHHASDALHFVLLAQLNGSIACFWMKQVSQNKGSQGVNEGLKAEAWERFFQFGGSKLKSFPIASLTDTTLETFARHLDTLARSRVADSVRSINDTHAASGAAALRAALDARRTRDLRSLLSMVALQEELDWYCYRLYALDPTVETRAPDAVPPLRPGLRPFEIALARRDAENLAVLARGEEPDEAPTAWFTRHNWDPHITLDALGPAEQRIVEDRLARTESSRELGLLEHPTYKRRWYQPDYAKEEQVALTEWLADRIEDHVRAIPAPWTIAQVALALGGEADVRAVCEVLAGRSDYDVEALIGERVQAESVPNNKHHVFKPDGLIKRAAWEETWAQQHMEDEGKPVTPAVPPKYASGEYLRSEYWSQRGKLDVPKERFIAFTEVPGPGPTRYGWAGWTHRTRARTLVDFDEQLENDGVPMEDRIGVLHGVWFLLPWVRWESAEAAEEFRAIVQAAVGREGVTEAMLTQWAATHPPGGGKTPKTPKTPKNPKNPKNPKESNAPRGPKEETDV